MHDELADVAQQGAVFSGPMTEPAVDADFKSVFGKHGAHYNIFKIQSGIDALRRVFPDSRADELNLILFSTSGVHGTYITLEEIEHSLQRYPDGVTEDEHLPDDYVGDMITVLVLQPRTVTLRYGEIRVTLADIPWLRDLRKQSWEAFTRIGK